MSPPQFKSHWKSAADFSSQIRQNLMSEIIEEEWVIKSIGRNLLDRINMLPDVNRPIQVKELYETFLRFDDKPMITGPTAISDPANCFLMRVGGIVVQGMLLSRHVNRMT